jgi:hypothetical protein
VTELVCVRVRVLEIQIQTIHTRRQTRRPIIPDRSQVSLVTI